MPSVVQGGALGSIEAGVFRRSRFLTRNRSHTLSIAQGVRVRRHSERPKGTESGDAPRSEPDAGERRIEKRIIVRGPAPHESAEMLIKK